MPDTQTYLNLAIHAAREAGKLLFKAEVFPRDTRGIHFTKTQRRYRTKRDPVVL